VWRVRSIASRAATRRCSLPSTNGRHTHNHTHIYLHRAVGLYLKLTRSALCLSTACRTNRTRGTKILRCFPHCCPEHVDRSYCGAALYVTVDNARPDMMVFAHFEESDANFLRVDDEIDAHVIGESIQTEQTPKGEWIEGFTQSTAYEVSSRYCVCVCMRVCVSVHESA